MREVGIFIKILVVLGVTSAITSSIGVGMARYILEIANCLLLRAFSLGNQSPVFHFFSGLGRPEMDLLPVEKVLFFLEGFLIGILVFENHEPESSSFARFEVFHYIGFLHASELLEVLEESVVGEVPRKAPNKQLTLSFLFILLFGLVFLKGKFTVDFNPPDPMVLLQYILEFLVLLESDEPESTWTV